MNANDEWSRIIRHFEENARSCIHGNRAIVIYEPGCLYIHTEKCNCNVTDGDGLPLSQVLAKWPPRTR